MLDAALAGWRLVRRVPRPVWGVVALAALCGALVWWSEARRAAAYRQGRRDAAAGVVFDSLLLERAAVRVAKQMAHTDTVTVTVVRTARIVDSLVIRVPDSLKAVPEVAALAQTARVLTRQVDSLVTAHALERLAWVEKAKVDSAAVYALRVIATARGDTITALQKRPRWRTLVGTAATVGVAAFLGGRR